MTVCIVSVSDVSKHPSNDCSKYACVIALTAPFTARSCGIILSHATSFVIASSILCNCPCIRWIRYGVYYNWVLLLQVTITITSHCCYCSYLYVTDWCTIHNINNFTWPQTWNMNEALVILSIKRRFRGVKFIRAFAYGCFLVFILSLSIVYESTFIK